MTTTGVSEDLLVDGLLLYYPGVGWICQYERYWGRLYWDRMLPYFLRDVALHRQRCIIDTLEEGEVAPVILDVIETHLVGINSDILLIENHAP